MTYPFTVIRKENTLGWKAEMDGTWYGAYVEFESCPTDEDLRRFASSILFFMDNQLGGK